MWYLKKENKKRMLDDKTSQTILAYGEKTMLVQVSFAKGGVGLPHSHVHEQISYVLSGEFEYTVANETKLLKPGDCVVVPSNTKHGCVALKEDGVLLDVFSPIREDFLGKNIK